ncbi:DUF1905 domain-containing protein [Nocardioides sp.]|uniref:DUF1905 domain-containing protein n=1 Tax=Nocardioides sp. TaxID=35761 RepID=UPI003511066A
MAELTLDLEFAGPVIEWRGPAPFYFVELPDAPAAAIEDAAALLTYGWGAIPALATTGATTWRTSLFPKDGTYLLPVKAAVRRAESIELGDVVEVAMRVGAAAR